MNQGGINETLGVGSSGRSQSSLPSLSFECELMVEESVECV